MRKNKIFGVVIAMFLVIGFASESSARWYEDQQFNFRINVPDYWQSNSFTDGTDRVYAFVTPDQNVAVRIRAFEVNPSVSINQVISVFESHIFGGGERLSLQDHTLNGIYGKWGIYRGVYNGIQVGVSVFYAIQGSNAYIVWGMIPTALFEDRSTEADAITNTFTITVAGQRHSLGSHMQGGGTGRTANEKVVPVKYDRNIVIQGGPYIDFYWVETDGTQGVIELYFQDGRLFSRLPRMMFLRLHVPNVQDAQSDHGLDVYVGSVIIGSLSRADRNEWYEIPLNVNGIPRQSGFTLILRGSGTDGLAVSSKKSGYGAQLKALY